MPVPGGVGAAEAGLIAGLVALGVSYLSLRWLRRKAYI
jgi:hypothetical protein